MGELNQKSETLTLTLDELIPPDAAKPGLSADVQVSAVSELVELLTETAAYDRSGGATPYAALVEGVADSEGMALAYVLFCNQMGEAPACEVVEGTLLTQEEPATEETVAFEPVEEPHFWVSLRLSDGETLYLDPSNEDISPSTAQEFFELGYLWPGGPQESETETQSHEETKTQEDAE